MSEKFQEKYRISSARLQNWDYGWNAIYFITLCTAGHEHKFGKIVEGVMHMSDIGLIAEKIWCDIPQHFKFIDLDAFVVMPNHLHCILIINKNDDGRYMDYDRKDMAGSDSAGRDAIYRVSAITTTTSSSSSTTTTTFSGTGGITGKHNPMLHKIYQGSSVGIKGALHLNHAG